MTNEGLLTGVAPVAPTIFTEDQELDLAGQRRVCDYLIDAGSEAICVLANYSEQFSVTDAERVTILDEVLDQVAGRVPVVVTVSHFSTRVTAERGRDAVRRGADMIMVMPPFFGATLKATEQEVVDHFRSVADGVEVPIMIQDSPMSTTPMSVELLGRVATEIDNISYAKIEVPRAAAKIEALGQFAGVLPGVFDGEEAVTLIPDLAAGAVGTMSSALAVHELAGIMDRWRSGDRAEAESGWESLLPLLHFENRQCGLNAAKTLLQEGGIITSDRTRAPISALAPRVRSTLVELARRRNLFALSWAA